MESEWWDQAFIRTYTIFIRTFARILIPAGLGRLVISLYYNYLITVTQWELFSLVAVFLLISIKLNNASVFTRKIYLYLLVEIVNIVLKMNSVIIFPEEKTLLLLESTLVTILFQMKIFESVYAMAFNALGHTIKLYFWIDLKFQFISPQPASIAMSVVILWIWISFEVDKRTWIKENFFAKESIKKSNQHITEFLRLFSDGLLIMGKNFSIKYTNDTIYNILKPTNKDYIAKLHALTITDSDTTIYEKLLKIKWDSNSIDTSIGVTRIEDSLYEWTIKISNWEDELCYIIIVKDVTKILFVERMASENRSKRELIRSVSHELRTPINAISLIIDEIFDKISDELKEKLSMITSCVWLLNCHVSDILDYSELVSGKFILNPSNYNIKKSLLSCTKLFSVQSIHKGVELITKIDPAIPDLCFADEFRVQKVVTNLLSNAIKFTNKGAVELCAINTGQGIEISVKDTGIGIHKDRLDLIFDLFSENQSGMNSGLSGLGLHISNNILKLAGTSLRITSKIGEGSTFSFYLDAFIDEPRCDLSSEIDIPCELTRKTQVPESTVRQKLHPKILIVDDNEFNRLTLGNILRIEGIEYIEAINGEVGVQIVSEYDRIKFPIKLVIMDCNMPVMDGWEATKRIISKYNQGLLKYLPTIIGHTAYSSKEDIQRCYDSGMTSHFLKPTTQEQFLSIIVNYV